MNTSPQNQTGCRKKAVCQYQRSIDAYDSIETAALAGHRDALLPITLHGIEPLRIEPLSLVTGPGVNQSQS